MKKNKRNSQWHVGIAILLWQGSTLMGLPGASWAASRHTFEMISAPLKIDRIYRSMAGPAENRVVRLTHDDASGKKELIWLTGIKTEILDAQSESSQRSEYLCHVTFASNTKEFHAEALVEHMKYQYPKLLSLFQGQTSMRFPGNFGMPALSTDEFFVTSMVLNNNEVSGNFFELKVKNTVEYRYDREVAGDMKPLFRRSYILRVPVKNDGLAQNSHCAESEEEKDREGSIEQKTAHVAPVARSLDWLEKDADENILSLHWLVPPGRHIYHYRLPKGLEIPGDTTAHYISTHLHPFGQSMAIRDLTTGKTVYKARVKNFRNRRGIAHAEYYSSKKGIVFYKDHAYELVCEYNNTTSEDVDAMAMMLVFFLDKKFDKKRFLSFSAQ